MCERTETAVAMLKQRKANLTKGEIIMVFEKVIEDQRLANQDIREMKKDVSELKTGFAVLTESVADIKKILENAEAERKKKSFWEKIPLLKEVPIVVWFIIWTVVIAFFCLLGVNPNFIQYMKGM